MTDLSVLQGRYLHDVLEDEAAGTVTLLGSGGYVAILEGGRIRHNGGRAQVPGWVTYADENRITLTPCRPGMLRGLRRWGVTTATIKTIALYNPTHQILHIMLVPTIRIARVKPTPYHLPSQGVYHHTSHRYKYPTNDAPLLETDISALRNQVIWKIEAVGAPSHGNLSYLQLWVGSGVKRSVKVKGLGVKLALSYWDRRETCFEKLQNEPVKGIGWDQFPAVVRRTNSGTPGMSCFLLMEPVGLAPQFLLFSWWCCRTDTLPEDLLKVIETFIPNKSCLSLGIELNSQVPFYSTNTDVSSLPLAPRLSRIRNFIYCTPKGRATAMRRLVLGLTCRTHMAIQSSAPEGFTLKVFLWTKDACQKYKEISIPSMIFLFPAKMVRMNCGPPFASLFFLLRSTESGVKFGLEINSLSKLLVYEEESC
eukprot:TRINITY_DN3102_c0_g1_i1.p1 TRINITY_DN3102_c0_g1~~TRINITY_DN3102_c0_g1_i1.p1  ORF type:complete len:445 (+),score=40.17 TRINITY_DN3102_c0_g1_i1:68-1336(+)